MIPVHQLVARTGWSAGKASACSSPGKTQPKPLLYLSHQPDPNLVYHNSSMRKKSIITDENGNVISETVEAQEAQAGMFDLVLECGGDDSILIPKAKADLKHGHSIGI